MRYIHYIFILVASIVVSACVTTDIDEYRKPVDRPTYGGDLQVVGRITQYSDCDVATRSKKEGDESKVTSMGLALFPINDNGTIGNCLYYDFQLGGSIVFIVDRHDEVFDNYVDKEFAMYIFANMQDANGFPTTSEAGVGKSLDYFTKCAVAASTTVKDVPANGFPMVGSLGNTLTIDGIESDGKTLILKPTQTDANVDGLPLVGDTPTDIEPTDNLEIPLKSLYAKFSFTISVVPDQEIVGNKAPRFDLVSYQVNNIAATVDSDASTNDDNAVESSGEISMGNYAQGATKATFTFYLPERYLTPTKNINNVLPDNLKDASTEEQEKYRQRYKNKLVDDKAATYVTITGKYTDHQENAYDVFYNIYLGGNNYDDFNIIRNTHYDNSITIRGISASNDQSVNGGISIDWRVNVVRSTPLVINLRRESLLDAHYEVRPLRLRLVGENIPTGTSATVQIISGDLTDSGNPWIRLEASGTTNDYITTAGSSNGKRKYFTTDLVTTTLADRGKSVTVNNLTRDNQTVWIYVDENTKTTSRAAIVRVSYDDDDKDFEIVQHGLFMVTGADSGRGYYIEQYEEYLYNYDSEDSYGQIREEGMPWGLDGTQLSNKYNSFTINENNSQWNDYLKTTDVPKYDFYIKKYDSGVVEECGATKIREFAGQEFTSEIASNPAADIEYLTMDKQPRGAVEYCYSKNKRNADGTVDVQWYLPSADELEDFIVPAYSAFEEFQDNYYWTSQPAYYRNVFYYEYDHSYWDKKMTIYCFPVYDDNTYYARATKVVYNNGAYDYVPSGLNTKPNPEVNKTNGLTNFGWFYMMHKWKRTVNILGSGSYNYEKYYSNPDRFRGGEEYDYKVNSTESQGRYYVHLGHDEDMIQKTKYDETGETGYKKRTESHRVRCVRKQ